jgi:hypothetical protein
MKLANMGLLRPCPNNVTGPPRARRSRISRKKQSAEFVHGDWESAASPSAILEFEVDDVDASTRSPSACRRGLDLFAAECRGADNPHPG